MIQLSILKITGYGPWTLTLGSDREHHLQMLQASLYKEIQDQFSKRHSLVFLNRSDEYFAISNGLTLHDHIEIQKHLQSKFELKLAVSIGVADTPYDANLAAFDAKRSSSYLDEPHTIFGHTHHHDKFETIHHHDDKTKDQMLTIMHMDIEDLTSSTKTHSPYEITSSVFSLYAKMSAYFMKKGCLAFFLGGDNFMILSHYNNNNNSRDTAQQFLNLVKDEDGITLNCGIGHAKTGREAAMLATKSLDTIRKIRDSAGKEEKPSIYESSC